MLPIRHFLTPKQHIYVMFVSPSKLCVPQGGVTVIISKLFIYNIQWCLFTFAPNHIYLRVLPVFGNVRNDLRIEEHEGILRFYCQDLHTQQGSFCAGQKARSEPSLIHVPAAKQSTMAFALESQFCTPGSMSMWEGEFSNFHSKLYLTDPKVPYRQEQPCSGPPRNLFVS